MTYNYLIELNNWMPLPLLSPVGFNTHTSSDISLFCWDFINLLSIFTLS
jgi:hypothetical protein